MELKKIPPKPPAHPEPPKPPPIRFEQEDNLHLEYIILFLLLASFLACFSEVLH